MPMRSKAQNRLMRAAAAGKSSKVPMGVAKEYVAAQKGKPIKSLPERKTAKKKP